MDRDEAERLELVEKATLELISEFFEHSEKLSLTYALRGIETGYIDLLPIAYELIEELRAFIEYTETVRNSVDIFDKLDSLARIVDIRL